MKRLLLIFLWATTLQAANEIRAFEAGATTCFCVIRQIDGDVWYVSGEVFEPWGTDARTADDYDIALTNKSGGLFVGDFDTNVSAGYYHVVTHMQSGANPADSDPAIWQDYGYWSGSVWTTGEMATAPTIADSVWDEAIADHTGEATFGGELQQLDPNITLILADTNELQADWTDGGRLDNLVDAIKAMTDLIAIVTTTVSDANDANSFTLTAGIDVNDALWLHIIMVEDANDGHKELRYIEEWLSSRVVLLDEPLGFVPDVGDNVWIMGTGYGGYLYTIWYEANQGRVPVYYYNQTTRTGGGTGGAGGTTYYDATGSDPR